MKPLTAAKLDETILEDLFNLLRVANGQDEKLLIADAPMLSIKEILEEYQTDSDDSYYDDFQDDDKVRCVIYHTSRIPFAAVPAEIHYLIDFAPGPKGNIGQVIWNTSECDYEVLADSLKELFELFSKGIKNKLLLFEDRGNGHFQMVTKDELEMWEVFKKLKKKKA